MPVRMWNLDLATASELPALPRGVILHWTGGGSKANAVDLAAYHFVVEADGTIRPGRWGVGANMRNVAGQEYARHTGGCNSFRVGISAAGMRNYVSPTTVGPAPLTEPQIRRMMELAAYFVELAGLDPLDHRHLCTHREVWTLHRIKGTQNHLKKDIEFLPFRPELKPDEIGDFLRRLAADSISAATTATFTLPDPLEILTDLPSPVPSIAVPHREPQLQPPRLPGSREGWWDRLTGHLRR